MIQKHTQGPCCKNCQKKIRKKTLPQHAPRVKNTGWPIKDWMPKTNGHVISKQYAYCPDDDGRYNDRRLDIANIWDGQSYNLIYGFFCSIKCAACFGQKAAAPDLLEALKEAERIIAKFQYPDPIPPHNNIVSGVRTKALAAIAKAGA